ncbi:MAG: hypothetical protein IJ049_02120 [Oscillospiraceae bacterium]|nr:hypothetical protein [Oscillospiraceae bacterium]
MKNLFKHTSSTWVRYSSYEYRKSEDILYITPTSDSSPILYDPLEDYESLVLNALNLGRLATKSDRADKLQIEVMEFVQKHGLLGFMTALPTTPDFMEYEWVYLPKNHFIREETMQTEDYLRLFFPFEPLDVVKRGIQSRWSISKDKPMMALALTLADHPMAVNLCCQRQYAERYDWIVQVLQDWAFTFLTSFLYYLDNGRMDDLSKELFHKGVAAFGGSAPTYHIELRECPTIVWDFHSLLLQIQMLFSFMLTDESSTMRCCPNCGRVFVAEYGEDGLCPECRSR